jgi:hypothetical protein
MPTSPVSKVPEITPELLEANELEQQKWRKQFAVRSDARTHAERVIADNLAALDSLEAARKSAAPAMRPAITARMQQIRNDTAILCNSIGQFEMAAALTTCRHQRKTYREKVRSVSRDDDEWCEHPFFQNDNGLITQNAVRESDVYSERHGRVVSTVRCRICGFRNTMVLPRELQQLHDHRSAVRAGGKDTSDLLEIIR